MLIRHGLLELSSYPNKQSSIILNNEIIITSAIILEPYLKALQKSQFDLVEKSLTVSKKIIKVQEDKQFDFLKTLKFEIIFDERSKFEEKSRRILTRDRANLLYLYNCGKIKESLTVILENLNITNNYMREMLLSSFIILNFVQPNIENCYSNIYDFNQSVIAYDKFEKPINKLDDVLTICTPFGLEIFYKTINIGKISNILGIKDCLFIISNTLPPGCEGSAILNNKLHLIGILICTSLQRQNENSSLSLVGNFSYIIKEFVNQYGIKYGSILLPMTRQPTKWERSLVVIRNSSSQGTGTLVKILNRKFILTCSHILSKDDLISCRYIDGIFSSKVIWKNPNYNEPFDIAILTVPPNITNNYFVNLSDKKPRLTESIYNAGFPFFTNIDNPDESTFAPSIFEGRIIKYSPGVLISDGKLQAGQSGGPMFDKNGSLLGICVSNLKQDNIIYPNINTAVPVCDIKHILESFAKSNDYKILNNLIATSAIKRKWALETPLIESKL